MLRRPASFALVMTLALSALASPADARGPAGCQRASGNASVRCLDQYVAAVRKCRTRGEVGCDTPEALAAIVDRVVPPSEERCTDPDAETLGYIGGTADVVRRARESCVDFGEDFLGAVYSREDSASGALLRCQKVVVRALDKLRRVTIDATGQDCWLRAFKGRTCNEDHRDARLAEARAGAERRIARACGDGFGGLGLGPLDDLLDLVLIRARHYAARVYPPNDLGPTAELGPHPVGVRTLPLVDPSRPHARGTGPRPVTIEVYYPSTDAAVAGVPRDQPTVLGVPVTEIPAYRDVARAAGEFPLVVFSHGNGGIRFQSVFFALHLASHGYVVASPDHHGNTFVDGLAGIVDPNVVFNRPADMIFVIDEMLARSATPGTFLTGAVDPDRIGASGQSFGGFTDFILAGGIGSPFGAFLDPRVRAILPQAPAAALPEDLFRNIQVPTLIIGGSIDGTTPFPANQQRPFDLIPAGPAIVALAELANAGHFTFSDFCEVDRRLLGFLGGFEEACEPRHLPWRHAHDVINYLALAFFDGVLRDDAAALARLEPAAVAGIEDLGFERK
jgi:predicted dienelactone hydrolase